MTAHPWHPRVAEEYCPPVSVRRSGDESGDTPDCADGSPQLPSGLRHSGSGRVYSIPRDPNAYARPRP